MASSERMAVEIFRLGQKVRDRKTDQDGIITRATILPPISEHDGYRVVYRVENGSWWKTIPTEDIILIHEEDA